MNHSGTLYVVSTPIGNDQDWTFRAKQVLSQVPIIAAEDTRVLQKQLSTLGIPTPQVLSYFDSKEESTSPQIIKHLLDGKDVALTSDAGTPLVSDPGFHLVHDARKNEIPVVPVPGVSSLSCALSIAPVGGNKFVFGGFLPSKSTGRRKQLENLKATGLPLVFFEAPHRIQAFLQDAIDLFGSTHRAHVCRELTKPYEEVLFNELAQLQQHFQENPPKGEFVILLDAAKDASHEEIDIHSEIQELLSEGLGPKDIAKQLKQISSLPRKEIYKLAMELKASKN